MGKKEIKGRTLMFAAECICPVMMLTAFLPSLYLVVMERDMKQLVYVYRAGFLLLPFVCLVRGMLWKLKGYGGFLLLALATLAVVFFAATWLVMRLADRNLAGAFVVTEVAEILLILVDANLIRRHEIDRHRAELEHDLTWVKPTTVFEYPRYLHLIWFAVLYVNGLLLNAPRMCNILLASAAVFFLVTAAYTRARKTEEYLRQMNYISHIPVRRVKRIGAGVGLIFLLITVLLMVPAFLTSGLRHYTDIREVTVSGELTEEEWEMYFKSGDPEELMPGDFVQEPVGEPNAVLEYAAYAIGAALIIWISWILVKVIRGYFDEFRDRYDDNGDLAVSLDDNTDEIVKVRTTRHHRKPENERERIREEYRRIIRKHRKDRPAPPEMPCEIEEKAGLTGSAEGQVLHERYEHARYADWN